MKTIKILALLLSITLFSACQDAGVTSQRLSGNEPSLPEKLKGLEVYSVSCGAGEYIKVGLLNGEIVSTQYKSGKYTKDIILVNANDTTSTRVVKVASVISENDSILVIRKK